MDLPTDIVDTLDGYSPDQLQHVARYAEALAEHKEQEARLEEQLDDDERAISHYHEGNSARTL